MALATVCIASSANKHGSHAPSSTQKLIEKKMDPTPKFETYLEKQFPWIDWRRPLRIASPQGVGLACRFCIARKGIKAEEIPALPQNIKEFHAHLKEFHE